MIAARHHTTCPDCSEPIEPGDSIGQIGLYYVCAECVSEFERENRSAPTPVVSAPISGQWEPA